MALTRSANSKRKSGRRLAADALLATKCDRCGAPALITEPVPTNSGTKWISHCGAGTPCGEWVKRKKERGKQL